MTARPIVTVDTDNAVVTVHAASLRSTADLDRLRIDAAAIAAALSNVDRDGTRYRVEVR